MTDSGERTMPLKVAVAIAIFGLIAAGASIIYAIGPALPERTTYVWTIDDGATAQAFSSLELAVPTPENLKITIPCPATAQDHLRFRSDAASTGLIVTVEKERLVVTSQDKILFDTGWSRSTAGCPGVLSVTGHSWILHGPSEKPIADGNAPEITVSRLAVTGTHAMTAGIRAEVTTQPHGSNPTTRQAAAAIIVTVCSMLLALALFRWRPGRGQRIMLPRFRPTWFDGAVVVFTAAWALLALAFYDDGWFLVT